MNAVTRIVVAFQENKRGCWRGFWGGGLCEYRMITCHRSLQTPNIASPEGHLCVLSPPGKAGPPTWGCAVPGPAELWVSPGMEIPQWYLTTHMLKNEIISAHRAPRSPQVRVYYSSLICSVAVLDPSQPQCPSARGVVVGPSTNFSGRA